MGIASFFGIVNDAMNYDQGVTMFVTAAPILPRTEG